MAECPVAEKGTVLDGQGQWPFLTVAAIAMRP
jgi:hypothetical protein